MTVSCDTRLVYYPDDRPGISRVRKGRGFSYVAPDGTTIACPTERARLASLAVPPAYRNVWICPLPDGHLQATGYDDRERKQYRYHPLWSEFRDEQKVRPARRGSAHRDEHTLADEDAFVYWLFKRRMDKSDPAKVASDTRKGLAQLERMRQSQERRLRMLRGLPEE